ncbi:carbohydrate kinase family protein [Candidatus Saccharibacteria bacterium]|nr:carbohydrate kinase family protein [Candidatus Saccharibacteria bacterium]
MARIVSLGSALQDLYLIDRDDFASAKVYSVTNCAAESLFGELKIGSKVDIDKLSYEVGGGGTNSAVEFARHGHESIYFGNIGRDAAGEAVLACLDEEGVDSSYVSVVPRKNTGCSVILLDSVSGERTILTCRGASAKFDNLSIENLTAASPDYLYVTSLRGDIKTIESFFKTAKELGAKVAFNPGKLELEKKSALTKLLKYVDILITNKSEAASIVPGTVLAELVSRLSNYVRTVVITDGNMGGIAKDGDEVYRFGIYEDVPVRDTTGAGDAFGSGFLAHLAAGKSFYDSLVFASANATSVVCQYGAKRGLLSGREKLHQMPIQKVTE